MEGLAGVETKLPADFVMELCRHSLRRSTWSTLLPAGKSWKKAHDMLEPQEELEDEEYQVHPLWELCARGCAYRTTWKAPVHKPVHINLLEMKAHLREERRIACKHVSLRIPYALDSQVCLGATVKGRASATSLTRAMKKNLGYGIGSDLYGFTCSFLQPSTEQMNLPEAPVLRPLTYRAPVLVG